MTVKAVADDVLGALARRQYELFRRVQQGTLPADEVMRELQKLIEGKGLPPFADEEVESEFGYPKRFRIRSVEEQVAKLLSLEPFQRFDPSHIKELAGGELPDGAEGWAVIPKPAKVAKSYHAALELSLSLLAADPQFQNWRNGKLTEEYLQLKEGTARAYDKLDAQPGDFWVFPFQFGMRHRGRSVRRVRVLFTESEFGLGAYEAAVLLLTHPDRITGANQLYMDCAGIEYSPDAGGDFFACLVFDWRGFYGPFVLNYYGTNDFDGQWGACSGFLV
ncbi:MAG: hypothetical protein ACOZBH_02235 [Patescibacteria group bacterium]